MTVRKTFRKTVRKIPSAVVCFLIRCYQWTLRPFIGMQCRFHPSCSDYALAAVAQHGALRGAWLAMRRLLRCHPLHPGGFDPVPDPKES